VHESWKIPDPQAVVDDSTLNSSIQGALKADTDVRHLDVRVEAHNGTVMLSGFADNQAQLDRVNMLAWMVEGVKKVDNKMNVRGTPPPADG
jgi:hyperosmotically inducible protein